MTSQTRTHIEPNDVKAVRFDCNECGASVTLPISLEVRFDAVAQCPNCGRGWASTMQTSIHKELKQCADAIVDAKLFIKRQNELLRQTGSKGFTVSLEISDPSAPASSGKD